MARINRISITLCTLFSTTLPLTPMAHASKQARESSAITHITKKADKKGGTATTKKTQKTVKKAANKNTTKSKTASPAKKSLTTASKNAKARSKHTVNKTASTNLTEECTRHKGCKPHCVKVKNAAPGTLTGAHKTKVQKATKVVMNKLMQQIGKPYRWDGSSPRTGFDCSGLVYYAYKDLVETHTPYAANEVYRLRDIAPVERSELKNGDLTFFRIQGRSTIDHVDVYAGNDKFIQSPRTGREIRITSLNENCWQRHHVGAHRVVTPKTLRQNFTLLLRQQGKFIFCLTF